MVIVGVDLHKRTHTAVAVDESGRKLAELTVPASPDGHLALLRWAGRWPERRWALEDCRHLSRRLETDLLRAGEGVVRVPPKLMAGVRMSAREPGKSDPIDALAVARAAVREPDLPVATLDEPARELRLLVDHREDLVAERTREMCRLRWFLVELGVPEPPLGSLSRGIVRARLADALKHRAEPVARFARHALGRIGELTRLVDELEREISTLVAPAAPALLAIPGCGPLTAAKLLGETAGIGRFHSKESFARHNGTAPQPVWSGNAVRFRLSRGGNRQLNAALHRIAITQARLSGDGRRYLDHRRELGNTRREALRALRRRLSDVVFRALQEDAVRAATNDRLAAA